MMNSPKLLIAGIFAILIGTSTIYAQSQPVITTVGNGTASSCTEASLRTAITNAKGKYKPIIRFNCGSNEHTIKINQQFLVFDDLTIDGGNKIILDGQEITRHIVIANETNVTRRSSTDKLFHKAVKKDGVTPITFMIANIKLINGINSAIPGSAQKVGGSIYMGSNGKFIASNVTFRNNHIKGGDVSGDRSAGAIHYYGGAIYVGAKTITTISNSLFEGNSATYDGGAILFGAETKNTIKNTVFRNNSSRFIGVGGGGAFRIQSQSSTSISDSTFENNTAMVGGAVFNMLSSLTIKNSTFRNNSAVKKTISTTSPEWNRIKSTIMKELNPNGGAVYSDGTNTVNVAGASRVEGSVFENNSTIGGQGHGAGFNICLYNNQSVTVNNNTFRDNKVTNFAAGLRINCGGSTTVRNNTFIRNTTSATEGWKQTARHYDISDKTVQTSVSNNTTSD